MQPAFQTEHATVYSGHAPAVLRELPARIARVCVTSPPYWGLRSYQTEPQVWPAEPGEGFFCEEHEWGPDEPGKRSRWGDTSTLSAKQRSNRGSEAMVAALEAPGGCFCQMCGSWRGSLGLEPTPELYVTHIVQVFREVRRVLTDDGTLWCNVGDSFTSGNREGHGTRIGHKQQTVRGANGSCDPVRPAGTAGLKPKDLVGIPWMVAFALRGDGWYLRADCIWQKPNGMTDSTSDRPNVKDHEYVFLLAKSERYFFDMDAVREPYSSATLSQKGQRYNGNGIKLYEEAGVQNPSDVKRRIIASLEDSPGRFMRSVWSINTRGYSGEHFATMPEELARRCILAGTSERGQCPKCSAPWTRKLVRSDVLDPSHNGSQFDRGKTDGHQKGRPLKGERYLSAQDGWEASCKCGLDPVPDVVLEPFLGSGTTAKVANAYGRKCIGVDLQPDYLELQKGRLAQEVLPL